MPQMVHILREYQIYMPSTTTATCWTQCSFWDQKPSPHVWPLHWQDCQRPATLTADAILCLHSTRRTRKCCGGHLVTLYCILTSFADAILLTDTQLVWLHCAQCIGRVWSDEESVWWGIFSVSRYVGAPYSPMSDSYLVVKVILAPLSALCPELNEPNGFLIVESEMVQPRIFIKQIKIV